MKLHEKKISELMTHVPEDLCEPQECCFHGEYATDYSTLKAWAIAVIKEFRLLRAGLSDGGGLGIYGEDVEKFLIDRFEITEEELE